MLAIQEVGRSTRGRKLEVPKCALVSWNPDQLFCSMHNNKKLREIQMSLIEFKKEYLDIVKLLNSPAVVGMYRGKEVWAEIEKLMDKVSDGTLVLIDLRQANPLQYVFCQHAFGPLFQALISRKWIRRYMIFQMYNFHKPGFFRGVLKYLGNELPRKESESGFVAAGMYSKLIVGDEEKISFIGNLNTNEQSMLDVVNDSRQITSMKAAEKTHLPGEIVVDALRSLAQKYFIVEHSDKSGQAYYYSYYNYF